jgi:hypothetical protein
MPRPLSSSICPIQHLWRDGHNHLIRLHSLYADNIHSHNVVRIATGYGLDDRGVGVRVPVETRIFSSTRRPDSHCGPLSLLFTGYRGLSPGVKRQGREADHLPPTSAEVKKMYIYTSTPPYAIMT